MEAKCEFIEKWHLRDGPQSIKESSFQQWQEDSTCNNTEEKLVYFQERNSLLYIALRVNE